MADTEDVLVSLNVPDEADLLCIIANERGMERAAGAPNLKSVGYPLSVNDTFQRRNTNRSLEDSWSLVEAMRLETTQNNLTLVIYLSMGFGNPYNESWQPEDTARAVARLRELSVEQIALADTVGTATPELIRAVLGEVEQPEALGLHLHARPDAWQGQLEVALEYGVEWFEGAFAGIGGCPFADDELVGNLPTEAVLPWLYEKTGSFAELKEGGLELSQRAVALAAQFH